MRQRALIEAVARIEDDADRMLVARALWPDAHNSRDPRAVGEFGQKVALCRGEWVAVARRHDDVPVDLGDGVDDGLVAGKLYEQTPLPVKEISDVWLWLRREIGDDSAFRVAAELVRYFPGTLRELVDVARASAA
jgi:hypothetical protein